MNRFIGIAAVAALAAGCAGMTPSGPSAKATLAATAPLWTGGGSVDGTLDAAQWTAMADFMAAQGLTKGRVDPTPAFSNAYLG